MILITGSTGFVGMNLLKKLSKGNSKIIAIYRSEQKKRLVEKFLKSSNSLKGFLLEYFTGDCENSAFHQNYSLLTCNL